MSSSSSSSPISTPLYPNHALLTREELAEKFPQVPSSDPGYLHGVIANSIPEPELSQAISAQRVTHRARTSYRPFNGLTPLHIAVISGNEIAIQLLIEHKICSVDATDKRSWTALHHAALLPNLNIYSFLIRNKANPDLPTALGHTATTFVEMSGKQNPAPLSIRNLFLRLPDGTESAVTDIGLDSFLQTTGFSVYTDSVVLDSTESWKELWEETEPKDIHYYPHQPSLKSYTESLRTRPKKMIVAFDEKAGWHLIAGENLPQNFIIGTYTGRISHLATATFEESLNDTACYVYDTFDAQEAGNLTRFANSGLPNCSMLALDRSLTKTLECSALVVTDPAGIAAGQPILWDYGCKYTPLAYDTPVSLYRDHEIQQTFRPGAQTKLTETEGYFKHDLARFSRLQTRSVHAFNTLFYPLSHPTALLHLIFSNTTTAREWMEFFYSPSDIVQLYREKAGLLTFTQEPMLRLLTEFENAFAEHPRRQEIYAWVHDKLGKLTVLQILKALQAIMQTQLRREPSCSYNLCRSVLELLGLIQRDELIEGLGRDWPTVAEQLTEQLPHYRWRDDMHAPLHISRRPRSLEFTKRNPKTGQMEAIEFRVE